MTTAAEIVERYGHTWEAEFRIVALGLSLEIRTVTFDPAYGWTVLLEDGREFEALTTAAVRTRLALLAEERP